MTEKLTIRDIALGRDGAAADHQLGPLRDLPPVGRGPSAAAKQSSANEVALALTCPRPWRPLRRFRQRETRRGLQKSCCLAGSSSGSQTSACRPAACQPEQIESCVNRMPIWTKRSGMGKCGAPSAHPGRLL